MLIFIAVGFLDEPSVTLRDAERQIRPSGEICGIFMSKEFRNLGKATGRRPQVGNVAARSPAVATPHPLRGGVAVRPGRGEDRALLSYLITVESMRSLPIFQYSLAKIIYGMQKS